MVEEKSNYGNGYSGKRPTWQWILIYLIVGGLLYGVIYYFIIAPRSTASVSNPPPSNQTTTPFY